MPNTFSVESRIRMPFLATARLKPKGFVSP
jgi:hypothetical protein